MKWGGSEICSKSARRPPTLIRCLPHCIPPLPQEQGPHSHFTDERTETQREGPSPEQHGGSREPRDKDPARGPWGVSRGSPSLTEPLLIPERG